MSFTKKTIALALTLAIAGASAAHAQGLQVRIPGTNTRVQVVNNNSGSRGGSIMWPHSRQIDHHHYQGRHRSMASSRGTQSRIQMMPHTTPSRHWYMGVTVQRSPLGVMVKTVIPNSPAHRAGIEPGDFLLDAGGYVVGDYNGRHYPLSQAMDLAAEPDGWVEMMVWNRRTFQRETVWIQMSSRSFQTTNYHPTTRRTRTAYPYRP